MTAPGRQGQALRKLRLRLTLLSAALAGAVLVAMALLSLSLFDGQLRLNGETAFRSNMSAITTKLRSDRILTSEWLAQTEATERLIISISDGGSPLSFPGSWQSGTDRGLLVRQAQDRALSLGVNVNVPPLSILDTTLSPLFDLYGAQGERYLAAVALVPAHGSWQGVTLLRDMSSYDLQRTVLRVIVTGLILVGLAALAGLCWLFSGYAIRPIWEDQRRQAEFIAAASHELRSPLSVIQASLSALGLDPGQGGRLRSNMDRECRRMARLIGDLLTLAQGDAGTWDVRRDAVDLDTLLLETAEDFYPIARQKNQLLSLSVPETALPIVTGDSQRLRQILTVLLDNACSYTPEGGTITLSAQTGPGEALLRVADTGPGISPEHRERVFDRFYRADPSRSDRGHFGLGLPIARELALLHGGELSVERSGPQGTIFLLRLPT